MIDHREDCKWTVYIHIVPAAVNGKRDKYYVGITSESVFTRWGTNGKRYKAKAWKGAIDKYGWENIEHEIIASNLTMQEAKAMEKKMIALLKSNQWKFGYNRTSGGDAISPNTLKTTSKPIYQFSLDGIFIRKYCSVAEASRKVGVADGTIISIAKSKKIIGGKDRYIWRYSEDVAIENGEYTMLRTEKIIQYNICQFDTKGVYIRSYISPRHAADVTGIPYDIIHGQLRSKSTKRIGKNKSFIWRYVKDTICVNGTIMIKEPDDTSYILGVDVYQFDLNKKFIAHYKNAVEATASINGVVSQSAILRQIKNKPIKFFSPYYWRGKEDVTLLDDGTYCMTN